MDLWSDNWADGATLPERLAAGRREDEDGAGHVGFSHNLSPHLAWRDLPAGTRSLALICHDPDAPSRGDDVNQTDREVPADLPRVDFFHWVMCDIPPDLGSLAEGEFSDGFTARGKSGPLTLHGARHGLNDYTGWFSKDAEMVGHYFGYDGPFPPFNDSVVHRYVFTLYALSVPAAPVIGGFTGAQLRRAIAPHVLGQAALTGTYTLNLRLRG